jgi:hypothetical protein
VEDGFFIIISISRIHKTSGRIKTELAKLNWKAETLKGEIKLILYCLLDTNTLLDVLPNPNFKTRLILLKDIL